MARKSVAVLKNAPVKLDATAKAFLKQLAKIEPAEGCEEYWQRYVKAATEHEEQIVRADALLAVVEKEGGSSSCKTWPAYSEALKRLDQTMRAAFGALDAYNYQVEHRFDKVGVPESELRQIIADSFSGNVTFKFNLANSGLLAAKVAQAVRKHTAEEAVGEPPFCDDCQS